LILVILDIHVFGEVALDLGRVAAGSPDGV